MPDVIWLAKDLSAGLPTLLHPPRGTAWWRAGAALVVHDGARAWVDLGDRVAVVPLGDGADVVSDGDQVLLTDASGAAWRLGVGLTRRQGRRLREGLAVEVHRPRGAGWVVDAGRPLEIPLGVTDANEVWPWRTGAGLLFATEGWLYRWPLGGPPRAVAAVGDGDRVLAGPHGAFLIGRNGAWTEGAIPGGSATRLPIALSDEGWGVRWSGDGKRIAGVDEGGEPVRIELIGGAPARIAGLPLDADGAMLLGDGTIVGAGAAIAGVREASWALDGRWLGGPGGVVWDLTTGRRLFEAPALRLGATVATPAGWATVDWEDGRGLWVDPAQGRTRDPFVVPLEEDDTIDAGAASGTVAVFTTGDGSHWAVDGPSVRSIGAAPSAVAPLPDPSFRIGRDGLVVGGQAFPLPVEGAVRVGGRVWAWSTDGLLVAFPVPA